MRKNLPISVDTFKELFVNREDIYSIQEARGETYRKTDRPVTDQTIKDHLLGKHTIGLYQLSDNKVKWALIDIDINKEVWSLPNFKVEDWTDKIVTQAKKVKTILSDHGMVGYRESSGFKGEHVWVFFAQPVHAPLVKNVFDSLFKNMPLVDSVNMHIEIFPKQFHTTDTGPGSLVKAPLGKHQRSGVFSEFIDDISTVVFSTEETLKNAINEYDAIFLGCSALRNIRDEGIHSEHLGHDERLALAYIYGNLGEVGIKYIEEKVFSKLSDYDPEKTSYQLLNIAKKGYKPVTCKTLQSQGLCPGPCASIGVSKSPITFFYRQQGIKTSEEEEIKCRSKIDSLRIKGHSYYDFTETIPEKLSNFVINLFEQLYIDDGFNESTIFRGHIINEEGPKDIEIDAKDFASAEKFSAAIYKALGNSGTFIGDPIKIRHASNKFSQKNRIVIKKIFGYNDKYTKYYTPSVLISSEGVMPNEELIINLEGEKQAEHLDLAIITDKEFEFIKTHITEDLLGLADFETTHTAFAYTMLAPILPFVDTGDKTRFAYFLRGQSGTGKSFLLGAMQNFYGNFPEDVVAWTSTPYSIQRLGYFYKDVLFLVDDFKKANIPNYPAALQVLQNYADNTARSRLMSTGEMGHSWPIKGCMAITGEDVIEGETSNIARMVTVEYSTNNRDIVRGGKVKKNKHLYKGFTARYIHHILLQDKEQISDTRQKYFEKFLSLINGSDNDIRISRNIAILMTSYVYLANFLWDKKEAVSNISKVFNFFSTLLVTVTESASNEKSSHRFWKILQELIATDKAQILPDNKTVNTPGKRGQVVGFMQRNQIMLIKDRAYAVVQESLKKSGQELKHSMEAVYSDLEKDGVIKSKKTVPRKLNGTGTRVIPVEFDSPDLIGEEESENKNTG
jgi:hypothetical protein